MLKDLEFWRVEVGNIKLHFSMSHKVTMCHKGLLAEGFGYPKGQECWKSVRAGGARESLSF